MAPRLLAPARLVALALLATAAAAGVLPARAEPPPSGYEAFAAWFKRESESEGADARLRAFQRVAEVRDPRAVDLVLAGTDRSAARRDAVAKAQTETETALEGVLTEIEKANAETPSTPREIEAYNKKVKKLESRRDDLYAKQRDLAYDAAQEGAILSAAGAAAAAVTDSLEPAQAQQALDRVTAAWAGPKSTTEERVRRVDVLAAVHKVPTGPALREIALAEGGDPRVRVAALSARVAREDEGVVDDCVRLLESKDWPVAAAAIDGLRRLHRREGIEPLIALLARDDVGRLREDAHRALRSLTGEKHGPYAQPWKDWWETAKARFTMPEKPAEYGELLKPEKGVTFYGITTFSDKILFVLDVSGSMNDPAHPDAGGARGAERKIDVARRELASALAMLDAAKRFNIVFFGHKVVRYQAGMIAADKAATERARRFANELEPVGGTNIHDALETAFRLANTAADGKNYLAAVDTVFFMTDGTPTAGKIQKPDGILAAVREWNRTARITIHCIGVGDSCDAKFLEALASQNGGVFVRR